MVHMEKVNYRGGNWVGREYKGYFLFYLDICTVWTCIMSV